MVKERVYTFSVKTFEAQDLVKSIKKYCKDNGITFSSFVIRSLRANSQVIDK